MKLENLIEKLQETATRGGQFGVDECRRSILSGLEISKKYGTADNLFMRLEEYINRCKNERLFNKTMVLACWELIQELEVQND